VLGCIMLGQFHGAQFRRSPYADRWQGEFGTTVLQQAYEDTPVFSTAEMALLMDIYQGLLDLVMRERLIRQGNLDLILPVIRRLEDNLSWSPTLEEAAEYIGRSPSSLTRQFRNITGKSFKKYLVRHKLDQADRMMREQPRKPLNEIAWELGYQDPLYFSRLYKKYRSRTPRQSRDEWRRREEVFMQPRAGSDNS
jgi:AraC-like DNA-binding protein